MNMNDDSYISAHSGLNLIGGQGAGDTSFIFSENFNPQQYVDKRVINNNYQNITNLRSGA